MELFYLLFSIFIVIIAIALLSKRKTGAEVTTEAARDMMKDSQVTILDVRTPKEYSQGHIEGAKLIPIAELSDRIGELNDLKNRQILIYCYRGNRSRKAAAILQKNGFINVMQLHGGITKWVRTGNKLVI